MTAMTPGRMHELQDSLFPNFTCFNILFAPRAAEQKCSSYAYMLTHELTGHGAVDDHLDSAVLQLALATQMQINI